jgi:hypothetical protein
MYDGDYITLLDYFVDVLKKGNITDSNMSDQNLKYYFITITNQVVITVTNVLKMDLGIYHFKLL